MIICMLGFLFYKQEKDTKHTVFVLRKFRYRDNQDDKALTW